MGRGSGVGLGATDTGAGAGAGDAFMAGGRAGGMPALDEAQPMLQSIVATELSKVTSRLENATENLDLASYIN